MAYQSQQLPTARIVDTKFLVEGKRIRRADLNRYSIIDQDSDKKERLKNEKEKMKAASLEEEKKEGDEESSSPPAASEDAHTTSDEADEESSEVSSSEGFPKAQKSLEGEAKKVPQPVQSTGKPQKTSALHSSLETATSVYTARTPGKSKLEQARENLRRSGATSVAQSKQGTAKYAA